MSILVLAAAAAAPSAALALDYHAAEGGSGTTCSILTPCNLPTAVNQANTAGDGRVLIAAGNYHPAGTLNVTGALDIGPEPGEANSTIHGPGTGNVVNIENAGVVLHDVALTQNDGNTALRLLGGTAERVFVTTSGGTPACSPEDGATLRDSLCWSTGSTSDSAGIWVVPPGAASPSTGNIRNVTAIGGRSGIKLIADSAGQVMTINGTNVIASGGAADVTTEPSGGGLTHLNLDHSNYSTMDTSMGGTITPPGTNGNQTAEPLFVNPLGGDFHQAPGSPTIDAGESAAGIGALDADRHARIQPACVGAVGIPDLGAFEASPPTASPRCSGFAIGALTRNRKKGTAQLTVGLPGAGVLSATGKGLKAATASSSAAGNVILALRAKGRALKKLKSAGKAKLNLSLVWAPTGNPGSSQTDKVKLKKK